MVKSLQSFYYDNLTKKFTAKNYGHVAATAYRVLETHLPQYSYYDDRIKALHKHIYVTAYAINS